MNTLKKEASLAFDLTVAQLKARYRKTLAGLVWVILNPLVMFGAQAVAFKHILKLDIENYYLYLLAGLVPWIFIVMTLQMSTPVLLHSSQLLKSFRINPLNLVLSQVLDNLFNFLLAFVLMYIPIQSLYGMPSWHVLLAPIPLLLMLMGVAAISVTLSIFQVFYRDVGYVVNFVTGVLFFVTPIFFTAEMIIPDFQWILNLHPPYLFIDAFRVCFYEFTWEHFGIALLKSSFACTLLTLLAFWTWNRKRNELYLKL